MLTVSQLAQRFGVSRTTLLYYHRIGLLVPRARSEAGYRLYGELEIKRLEKIRLYREAGVSVERIKTMLCGKPFENDIKQVLESRLESINEEISQLRTQQQIICCLLADKTAIKQTRILDKQAWVALLSATGLSEEDMCKWHIEFERMAPQAHQDFLESLGIEPEEIQSIRAYRQ